MILSTYVLLLATAFAADSSGPKALGPCEGCGKSPVSLSLANAGATTVLSFNFRTSSELIEGCVEMRIPLVFLVPNNTNAYILDQDEGMWRLQAPGITYSAFNDYDFPIPNVINPKQGSGYGPFSILTRTCCGCQIVDESLNFHFLAITPPPEEIQSFKVSVQDTPIPIDSEVTITIDVFMNIDPQDKLIVRLDPMWRLPLVAVCSFTCQYSNGRDVEITEIYQQDEGKFQVWIRSILSPYYVPESIGHLTQIWVLSPPSEDSGVEDSYIEYAFGNNTSTVRITPGTIYMSAPRVPQAISSSNLLRMDLVPGFSMLFVDVSLYLSHGLAGEGHRVEILMSEAWVEQVTKPDCVCWPKDACYCSINPSNSYQMTIYMARSIPVDTKITIRGLIEVLSETIKVESAVSYDPKGYKIDECQACAGLTLQSNPDLELLFQLTDLTGTQQLNRAGQALVQAQFVVLPPNADFLDKRRNTPVKTTLVLPRLFILPPNFPFVYFKKHSTSFSPLNDYHNELLRASVTNDDRNWRITVDISESLPLYYGMFTLMIPNVTLPAMASNVELAFEASIALEIDQKTYISTDQIQIVPSPALVVSANYYCIGDLPSSPIEISITAPSGASLNSKLTSHQYYLELSFPVNEEFGFGSMLGTNVTAGELYPVYFQSDREHERQQDCVITGDSASTTLTMELNTAFARNWVRLRLAVGRKLGDKDVPVTIRAYNQLRGAIYVKNAVFETVVLLKSSDSTPIPPLQSDKLRLNVTTLGRNGVMQLNITSDSMLKYLILVFPSDTGLGTVDLEPSLFKAAYFPFASFYTTLWLEYSSSEVLTDSLVLTFTGVSFKPEIAGFLTISAAESTSIGTNCPLLIEFPPVPSQPHLESITFPLCADVFAIDKVRGNLQADFNITNGVAPGTVLIANFEEMWGLNYTKCSVVTYSLDVKCAIDVGKREMKLFFVREIRANPLLLRVSVSKLRLPKERGSQVSRELGNFFSKVVFWYSEENFNAETSKSMVNMCTKEKNAKEVNENPS